MPTGKVLIIDPDKSMCELLRIYLEREGYTVITSGDGEEGLVKFSALKPDIVLLEIVLPGIDGWQICREIRKKSAVPLIYITSKGDIFDKVLGLELGADDYLVKPFDNKELFARMKAVGRRANHAHEEPSSKKVHFDGLDIDMTKYELKIKGEIVDAPPKELELLYHLASHPNTVFNRDQLLDEVWGFEYYGGSRTIDVHIKRLRAKLDGVSKQWNLRTVWSVGYKFEVVGSADGDI